VRSLDFQIPVRRGSGGRALITTPPRCPAGRAWITTATFGFKDGSSDTVSSATPCVTPRLKLTVEPRRVRPGQATRLKFAVRSASPRCMAGATIRLAGRSAKTDANGRAELVAKLRKRRRATVTHAGCRRASAVIRVR
jgi:hypothetical protein